MGNFVRSAMGELVDFQTLKIKQQLVSKSTSTQVTARQDFVESRAKRRAKRRAEQAARRKAALQSDVTTTDVNDVAWVDDVNADEEQQPAKVDSTVDTADGTAEDVESEKTTTRKQVHKKK